VAQVARGESRPGQRGGDGDQPLSLPRDGILRKEVAKELRDITQTIERKAPTCWWMIDSHPEGKKKWTRRRSQGRSPQRTETSGTGSGGMEGGGECLPGVRVEQQHLRMSRAEGCTAALEGGNGGANVLPSRLRVDQRDLAARGVQ
jgi:hypothetical protein